LISIYHL